MTLRVYELRESRRFAAMAAMLGAIVVLQSIVGRWWVVVLAVLLALLHVLVAAGSRWLAVNAEEWEEPKIARPRRRELWAAGVLTGACAYHAFAALAGGGLLDTASWLLGAGICWLHVVRTREQRRLTEPVKTPVRLGPPEEWIP